MLAGIHTFIVLSAYYIQVIFTDPGLIYHSVLFAITDIVVALLVWLAKQVHAVHRGTAKATKLTVFAYRALQWLGFEFQ